jgi:hypothetical protein
MLLGGKQMSNGKNSFQESSQNILLRCVPSRYGVGVAMLRQVAHKSKSTASDMDPISAISSAIQLIQIILDISKQVHANRQSAISLAERCLNLSIPLANLRSQHPIPPNYANLVEALARLLNEIDQFLRKFIKPTSLGDQALWYGMLAKDHRSHMNSFADYGNQIDKAISDLSVGDLVNVNQSLEAVQQNRTQDCQGSVMISKISPRVSAISDKNFVPHPLPQRCSVSLEINCKIAKLSFMIFSLDGMKLSTKSLASRTLFVMFPTNSKTSSSSLHQRDPKRSGMSSLPSAG